MLSYALAVAVALAASDAAFAAEPANELTDEQYAAFGLHPQDPEMFFEEADPLAGYEPTVYAELYVGTMNAKGQGHYEGSFKVLNDVATLDKANLSVKSGDRTLIGGETTLEAHDDHFQTQNCVAVDVDAPSGTEWRRQDEIAELALFGTETAGDYAELSLWRLVDDAWQRRELARWQVASSDGSYVESIDANTSKGYVAMCAGDFDDDGAEEVACYVPDRTGQGPFVAVIDGDGGEIARMRLASIDARFDVTSAS